MADISLLFDVAGGGDIDGESGREISRQLGSIVETLNRNPFKIKFEADETSYNSFKEKIDNLKKEIGQISIKIDTDDDSGAPGSSKRGKKKKKAAPTHPTVGETAEFVRKARNLLNKNTNAVNLERYKELRTVVVEIEKELEEAKANQAEFNQTIDGLDISTIRKATEQMKLLGQEIATENKGGRAGGESFGPKLATLEQTVDIIQKARNLLNKNTNASNSTWYTSLTNQVTELESEITDVTAQSKKLNDTMDNVPIEKIERIRKEMKLLGQEIATNNNGGKMRTSSGTSRQTTQTPAVNSLENIVNVAKKARTLLNNNTNASGLQSYQELSKLVDGFETQIDEAKKAGVDLNTVIKNIPIDQIKKATDQTKLLAQEMVAAGKTGKTPTAKTPKPMDTNALNAAIVRIERLKQRRDKALTGFTKAKFGESKGSYEGIKNLIGDITKLESRIGEVTKEEFAEEISNIEKELAEYSGTIKESNEDTKTFADRIKTIAKRFSEWFSVTHLITQAYQMLRKMVTAVVDIDSAMTELKKVTNETAARYDSFLRNAVVRAKNLGAALTDTVRATADFARLGYSIDEAEKMADAAIIYKNVGDGIQDINTASESIIATMQAFGVKANEVMTIVDKFNEVGNNFAVSSSGIGDALLRSAAAMHSAGNTIDETIALVAAANTIVQNPETVGGCSPNHTVMCV